MKLGPVALEVGMLIIAQSEANYFCSEEKGDLKKGTSVPEE